MELELMPRCRWTVAVLVVVFAAACASDRGAPRQERFTGDFDAIRERGRIRFLAPSISTTGIPRGRTPLQAERRLAGFFAELRGLEPEWVWVEEYSDLIPALQDGRGDVIVANYTATPERRERIEFSAPFVRVREVIVSNINSAPIATSADLENRTISVRRSSAFWSTVDSLAREFPSINLIPAPETSDTEELLYRVSQGDLDVTVADDLMVQVVRSYLPKLRIDMELGAERDIAWGVRPDNTSLRDTLDAFMAQLRPEDDRPDRYVADLPGIREHKVLRVLTRNNPTSYFVWRGHILGFEHDLMANFAKSQGLKVEFVVAPTRVALFTWLLDGLGDVVAAGITIADTTERLLSYTRSYNRVVEMIVTDSADTALTELADLAGRTIAVRFSSVHWATAARLQQQGIDVKVVQVPEDMETEGILHGVATGEYDLAIADSHILNMELTWRDDIRGAFAVTDTVDHGWITRPGDTELHDALNAYLDSVVRGEFYNITKRKYFGNPRSSRSYVTDRTTRTGVLSPYDDLIRSYSARYDFDWILITAQMYEESKFNPTARSFAGAVGLMQLMPQTAKGFGFDSLEVPAVSIHAGTQYLRHVWNLLDDVPDDTERMWFALASYNAGLGHINDARRLAEQEGLDPNVWFGNVAEIAPLLQRRSIHRQFQYGYCRCNEPVAYVRKIRNRHRAYAEVESR